MVQPMDDSRFDWSDDVMALCLTFVEGMSPAQVEARLGADGSTRRTTTFDEAADQQDFGEERFAVQLGSLDGWTVVVEPNGYICSQDAVLADLSAAGRAVMVCWNVNMDSRFGYARDGVLLRVYDPVLGTTEVGAPLPQEPVGEQDRPIQAALALAGALTGVRLTQRWLLDQTRPTATCPLVAPTN